MSRRRCADWLYVWNQYELSHGDYVHSHPHGHAPDVHPHGADRTPVASLDRRFGRWRPYNYARPVGIGVAHGLAGSAAVALLVVAAVREPKWAVAYLLVFGVGTIAGMMLVTLSIASAARLIGGRSETMSRRFGLRRDLPASCLASPSPINCGLPRKSPLLRVRNTGQ